ncbi:MAG: hypothetical protein HY581_07355 [Nitrospirae bacterium]|nr:hypothetical protein [Nitrospirota bacterium]
MRARWMPGKLALVVFAVSAVCLLAAGVAWAQTTWVDEITNSLTFYKANYPTSNWDPYQQKLTVVRDALSHGDQRTVRLEMNKFFRMLQGRAHGINDVAADELYNFSVMVTPIQEYGISLPMTGANQ